MRELCFAQIETISLKDVKAMMFSDFVCSTATRAEKKVGTIMTMPLASVDPKYQPRMNIDTPHPSSFLFVRLIIIFATVAVVCA